MSRIRPQHVTELLDLAGYIEELELEVGSLKERLSIENDRVGKIMDAIVEIDVDVEKSVGNLKEQYCKWLYHDKY